MKLENQIEKISRGLLNESFGWRVSLVPHSEIGKVWPKVSRYLKLASDQSYGRYRLIDIWEKLTSNEHQLWIVFDDDQIVAAITSTFTFYPQCTSLHGQFLGGDRLEEWRDKFCEIFDNWGRDNGCKFIEFTGRPGWAKALAPNGYKEVYRIFQKELSHG